MSRYKPFEFLLWFVFDDNVEEEKQEKPGDDYDSTMETILLLIRWCRHVSVSCVYFDNISYVFCGEVSFVWPCYDWTMMCQRWTYVQSLLYWRQETLLHVCHWSDADLDWTVSGLIWHHDTRADASHGGVSWSRGGEARRQLLSPMNHTGSNNIVYQLVTSNFK